LGLQLVLVYVDLKLCRRFWFRFVLFFLFGFYKSKKKLQHGKIRVYYIAVVVGLGNFVRPRLFPVLGFWELCWFSSWHSALLSSVIASLVQFSQLLGKKKNLIKSVLIDE